MGCVKISYSWSYVFSLICFLGHISVNFYPILKIFGTVVIYDFLDLFSKRDYLKDFYNFYLKNTKKIFVTISLVRDKQPKHDRSLFTEPTHHIKNIFNFFKIMASGGQKRYLSERSP